MMTIGQGDEGEAVNVASFNVTTSSSSKAIHPIPKCTTSTMTTTKEMGEMITAELAELRKLVEADLRESKAKTFGLNELPEAFLQQIRRNKPQNFSAGQIKLPPGKYLCNKGCGEVLTHGRKIGRIEETQILHDSGCPVHLEYLTWWETLKEVTKGLQAERIRDVPPAFTAEKERLKKNICFAHGKGFFKASKKVLEGGRSLLDLPVDKIRPPKDSSRSKK